MTNRFATFSSRMAVALTMILAIAACGGGGGGGGGFKGGAGSGGDGDTDTYFIQLSLNNSAGEPSSIVTANEPGTLQVLVTEKNANGDPVPDVIVNASTDSGLLDPSSGNGLTNEAGGVTFTVRAGADRGAGTIVVSVEDPSGLVIEESVNFEIGVGDLRLGYLDGTTYNDAEIGITPDGPIAAKGEAILSLAIVDKNGLPIGTAESIDISSICIDTGEATLTPVNPIPVVDGRVEVTYKADGCEGLDELTAEVIGVGAMAFGTIEISETIANGLTFVSATPELIVLRGTGGGPTRQEKSEVTFRAVDANAQPIEGIEVAFRLTTDVGGISFSPKTAITGADGEVSTVVSSGDVATVVRVVATADAGDLGEVSAVSDVLTVSTGLPDQNSISLSVDGNFVIEEGMTVDGVTRTLTVRMADKFNNPVPDGTAANFTTEYGAIQSSCQTVGGQCSVVWNSQAPRIPTLEENQDLVVTINDPGYSCPSHNGASGPCPDDLGMIRGGRSTIVVTAIGEESFIDANANGIYDEGERFANLTEAFLDINENGFYDPATTNCESNPNSLTCKAGSEEFFRDYNNNGVFDANGDDELNGYPDEGVEAQYNGLLCPVEGDGVWCTRELLFVNDTAVLILSTDPNWDIALYRGRNPATSTTYNGGTYTAYVSDLFNSKPTGGSTVKIDASGDCEISGKDSFEVPNTTSPGAFAVSFSQGGIGEENGEVTITLTPKDGGPEYSESWSCTPEPEPVDPEPCDPAVELCTGG